MIKDNYSAIGLNPGSVGASYSNTNYFVSVNYLDVKETIISNNVIDGEVPEGYPNEGSWGFTAVKQGGTVIEPSRIVSCNYITHMKVGIFTIWKTELVNNYIYNVDTGMDIYAGKYNHISNNYIRKFTGIGIKCEGSAGDYAEGNIIEQNIVDDEGLGAEYGIKVYEYARYNLIGRNTYLGSIKYPHYVYSDNNIDEDGIYSSTALTNLSNLLSNFPQIRRIAYITYYDGTYYYLCQIDLINRTIRKVQLS